MPVKPILIGVGRGRLLCRPDGFLGAAPRRPRDQVRSGGCEEPARVPGQGAAPEPRAPLTPHRPTSPQARSVQSQSALQPPPPQALAASPLVPRFLRQAAPASCPGAPRRRHTGSGAPRMPKGWSRVTLCPLPPGYHACHGRLSVPSRAQGDAGVRRPSLEAWPRPFRGVASSRPCPYL